MRYFRKGTGGETVYSRNLIYNDSVQVLNPSADQLADMGWEEYYPELAEPQPTIDDQLRELLLEQYNGRTDITDEEALKRPLLVYDWSAYKGKSLSTGMIVSYDGKLWRVRQAVAAVLEGQEPGLATAALYEVIEVEPAGTQDDPIPYTPPMEIFNGKYYTQGGVLYKCTRDSGQALSHDLAALVGLYVEVAPGGTGGGGDE